MIRTAAMAILLATSFMSHAAEEAKAKADPAKGKAIAETVCVACHGADGNSATSANPHLAAQHQEYIYKQLKNFKAVDGKPAARNNAIMGGSPPGAGSPAGPGSPRPPPGPASRGCGRG